MLTIISYESNDNECNIIPTSKYKKHIKEKEKYYLTFFVGNHKFWKDNKNIDIKPYIKDIKNGKAKILILFCSEWLWDGYDVRELLNDWIIKYKLPYNSIVLSSGNYNYGTKLKNHRYITYIPYSIWEYNLYKWVIQIHDVSFYKTKFYNHIINKKNRDKTYLCYNRAIRLHRLKLLNKIIEKNILNDGYVSFGIINYNTNLKFFSKELIDSLPLKFDSTNLNKNQAFDLTIQDYLNTYISVVTETTFIKNEIFISEKICKPLFALHPFIIVSCPGFLKFLKSIGYKTFSKWIDESYDNEINLNKRINKITNQIKILTEKSHDELKNMLVDMLPTLIHNHEHFITRATSSKFIYQLEEQLWK